MEFDLQTIGVDLLWFYSGSMSIRRLRVWVNGLPPSCRLWSLMRKRLREEGAPGTAIEDLPPEAWSETDWQLAEVRDLLGLFIWVYSASHRGKNDPEPPKPDPVPRPGGEKRRSRAVNKWIAGFGR